MVNVRKVTKNFVQFWLPRDIKSDVSIESRDAELDIPDEAYAYRFFKRDESHEGDQIYPARGAYGYTRVTYLNGEVYALDHAEDIFGKDKAVLKKARTDGNTSSYFVETSLGGKDLRRLNRGDRVFDVHGNVIFPVTE